VTVLDPFAAHVAPVPAAVTAAVLPVDPLPLPQPGWGAVQALDAVAEAALVLPQLAAPARVVRAVSTVVLQVGECAVKVHPPGTDPTHLARVHAVLADSPVALTAVAAPVVTSHGVVTVTPWTPPAQPLGWGEVGEVLRTLHDLPTAAALPAWVPLRRLPAQLLELPGEQARQLLDHRSALLDRLAGLVPALPAGAVHGDVSPDNVLATASGPRWIDLDFACAGLREYDVAAVVRRYGLGELSDADYRAFVHGYEADLRGWPGLALLDELCVLSGAGFRLWTDRCAGRPSDWLPAVLDRLSAAPAGR
jgi:Phosphotransferase enzyme family